MSDTALLKRNDVKNEIKRIKRLPSEQRDEQFKALHKRVTDEMDSICARIDNDQHSLGEKQKEVRRLLYCVLVFPKEYRKTIFKKWEKFSGDMLISMSPDEVKIREKVNTAHVSGLPLSEQAEVDIWWQDRELIFQSPATRFSLPVERVLGMGTTSQMTADALGGHNTYLTIEYKKEDEIKAIVVRVSYKILVSGLIKHFNEIKGTREIQKQEL